MIILYYLLIFITSINSLCTIPNNSYSLIGNNCSWDCNYGYTNIDNKCEIAYNLINPFGFKILDIQYNIPNWVIDIQYNKNNDGNIVMYLTSENNIPESSLFVNNSYIDDFYNNNNLISSFNNTKDAIYGTFKDFNKSSVNNYTTPNTAEILLNSNELITSKSCNFSGSVGFNEQYNFYIGLAEFIPISPILNEVSFMQIKLLLTKTDYLILSSYGNNKYTFINYVNTNINRINLKSLYASISFNINTYFNIINIPLESIQVKYNDIITYSCISDYSNDYLNSCTPNIKLCTVINNNNIISINVPLTNVNLNNNVYITFVVNIDNIPTILNINVPLDNNIIDWCSNINTNIYINEFISYINLIIGIAGNKNEFNNLNMYSNNNNIEALNSKSIESGLITLVISSKTGYLIELKDLYMIYITDINIYNKVIKLFNNTIPFTISNNPSLIPTSDLLELCTPTSNPFPRSSCILNNNMNSIVSDLNNKKLFNNEYLNKISSNYSSLLTDYYNLTMKNKKAYWINPGYNWNGVSRLLLSQYVIMISLINTNTNSRRILDMSTTKYYNNKNIINYGNTPEAIIAENLNISINLITSWKVIMYLKDANNICIKYNNQYDYIQSKLSNYISECASTFLLLNITSVEYNNCILNVFFILAFKNSSYIYFDLQKFSHQPNIISIIPINNLSSIIHINDANIITSDNKLYYCSFIAIPFILLFFSKMYYYLKEKNNNRDNICNSDLVFYK